MKTLPTTVLVLTALLVGGPTAEAQYFGRNKVQYRTFDFQVLPTEHFEIYYYPEESDAVMRAAPMAERFYARLSKVLNHDLRGTQPLILYASGPHFQQTNVVESLLGEGTGGVTESLRRRIVMPFTYGLGETEHVLGHELVHAFQYDILGPVANQPLWFIEGMAEYLSLGSDHLQTAVWMRDAASVEELPTLETLGDPRYFPYRFGHAFWAYVGQRFGDEVIGDILAVLSPAPGQRGGGDAVAAIETILGIDRDTLSNDWQRSVLETMLRPLGNRETIRGQELIRATRDFEVNVGPVLSPDGSSLAFLSSRDLLSIDLMIADARTGEVRRSLTDTAADPHYDSLQFIESAGGWDPDGRRIAVAALRKGRPIIAIFDAASGERLREVPLPGLDEALEPAWSPDGSAIVVSGLSGGLSDLYRLTLETGEVQPLTSGPFAELQPAWSPDGRRLVYITDRYTSNLDALSFGRYSLAVLDLSTGRSSSLAAFDGATHLSPQWVSSGVYFVADPDGVPDVYRLTPGQSGIDRLTRSMTGVIGITEATPVLSVARDGSRMAFVHYRDGSYEIRAIAGEALGQRRPAALSVTRTAARLAPATGQPTSVDQLLGRTDLGLPRGPLPDPRPYDADLGLDYAGQEFGVATGGIGPYLGGGLALRFSDMLGDHVVETLAQVNGGFDDLGGRVGYLNRRRRWNWGGYLQQVPYTTGFIASGVGEVDGSTVFVEQEVRDRQVDRQLTAVAEYPFGRASRVEFGGGIRHLSFERTVVERVFDFQTGAFLGEDETSRDLADPITLGEASAALVRDTAIFGATGPILGNRSRLAVEPTLGGLDFTTVVADARQYVMPVRPFTIAARGLHVGRYGSDAEGTLLSPLFLGFPNLVRGYDVNSFTAADCGPDPATCENFDRLLGSRIVVAGVELRAPLIGAFTGELEYGPVPVDLIAFFDAGVAWTSATRPSWFGSDGDRPWVRSVGAGVRVNVFGFAVMEFDAVKPLDRVRDGWRFVFGLTPGY